MYLPPLCKNVSNPIATSPNNSASLSLSVLTTIFNVLQPDNDNRYHVFLAILRVVKTSSAFENLKPQLKHIDAWLAQWQSDEEEQRKLYLAIADAAQEGGEDEIAYQYLIKALRTIPAEEAANQEARDLSVRALKTALMHPAHFDFQDLTALDSIQALRKSDLGALLLFDPNNIRYVTSTHIGEWARDKNARYVFLPREGDPILWDFGSAAKNLVGHVTSI